MDKNIDIEKLKTEVKEKFMKFDEEEFLLYHYQGLYEEMLNKKYDFSNVPEYQVRSIMYPGSWRYVDVKFKIEALQEAIENKVTLLETDTLNIYFKKL